MQPRTKFEEKILKEISSLPEDLQLKLSRILLFLKKEMIKDRFGEEKATEDFLSVCGQWKDYRTAEEQITDIIANRKSTNRTENIF
jgi:hypothetical protein